MFCLRSSEKFNFTINTLLHGFILLLFLSIFFMFYVSSVIKSNMESHLNDIIKDSINNIPPEEKKTIKSYIAKVPADILEKSFNEPKKETVVNNSYLYQQIILINSFLFILIVIIVLLQYLECGKCPPIFKIILINIIIFTFVGLTEYMFFTNIATKYIPAEPSYMINSVYDKINNNLQ